MALIVKVSVGDDLRRFSVATVETLDLASLLRRIRALFERTQFADADLALLWIGTSIYFPSLLMFMCAYV